MDNIYAYSSPGGGCGGGRGEARFRGTALLGKSTEEDRAGTFFPISPSTTSSLLLGVSRLFLFLFLFFELRLTCLSSAVELIDLSVPIGLVSSGR